VRMARNGLSSDHSRHALETLAKKVQRGQEEARSKKPILRHGTSMARHVSSVEDGARDIKDTATRAHCRKKKVSPSTRRGHGSSGSMALVPWCKMRLDLQAMARSNPIPLCLA
jgi:hypothetical protein